LNFLPVYSRYSWQITNLMYQYLSMYLFISNSLHVSSRSFVNTIWSLLMMSTTCSKHVESWK
jgi:hypothetical protein